MTSTGAGARVGRRPLWIDASSVGRPSSRPRPLPKKTWTERALAEVAEPRDDDARAREVRATREALVREGFPARADGVTVYVIGESHDSDHWGSIVRAIAGPVGLAPGAAIHVLAPSPTFTSAIAGGEGLEAELGRYGRAMLIGMLDRTRTELEGLREEIARHGRTGTSVANMSWGMSIQGIATSIVLELAAKGGSTAPVVVDGEAFHLSESAHRFALRSVLARRLAELTREPALHDALERRRRAIADEVARLRDAGVLLIAAAGNDNGPDVEEGADENLIASVPGVLFVGAVGPASPEEGAGLVVAPFSGRAARVFAPGVGLPVGKPRAGYDDENPRPASGTSYAAPVVASIAALLLAYDPTLSPADLEGLLSRPCARSAARRGPDTVSVVDPVAVMRLAEEEMRDAGRHAAGGRAQT